MWDWGVNAARFSPDGRLLAGGCDKTMSLWDVTDPAHPAQWSALTGQGRPGWTGAVKAVDFSPDGRLVAMGATNGVVFWDITDPARPARIAFAREEDKDLGWWARAFGAQGYPAVRAVAFSPDGRLLATVGGHVRATRGRHQGLSRCGMSATHRVLCGWICALVTALAPSAAW
jgi:WD40 repeat protein